MALYMLTCVRHLQAPEHQATEKGYKPNKYCKPGVIYFIRLICLVIFGTPFNQRIWCKRLVNLI